MQPQSKVWFPWKPEYSLSLSDIDSQHKRLVDIINQLQDAMSRGEGKNVVGGVLSELESYTRTHFEYEEMMLIRLGYPQIDKQKAEHKAFVDKIVKFRAEHASGTLGISVQMMDFLRKWLTDHILREDRAYVSHVASKRA